MGDISPAFKKYSLCVIMKLVAHFDLKLHLMVARTALLNGDLEEEVHMINQKCALLDMVIIWLQEEVHK